MSTTFENARIGDRVWCIRTGWCVVKDTCPHLYSIIVKYENGKIGTYTADGFYNKDDVQQTLFWDEVVIKAPSKPVQDLPVDTKVMVWSNTAPKARRYFSHFNPSGEIECFVNGMTSWTTKQTMDWPYWELPE